MLKVSTKSKNEKRKEKKKEKKRKKKRKDRGSKTGLDFFPSLTVFFVKASVMMF